MFNRKGLTFKLSKRLLAGLGAGVFVMLFLYLGGATALYNDLYQHIFGKWEDSYIEKLQEYVMDNNIAADDTEALKKWAEDNGINRLIVTRDDELLIDTAYWGVVRFGAVELYESNGGVYPAVNFSDGEAYVSLSQMNTAIYYLVALGISVICGVATCLAIFAGGVRESIRYIQTLEREVDVITGGDLDGQLTIKGEDEITSLASGLKTMRNTIKDDKQREADLKDAQNELVRGLAHDLKTPLTGLITYSGVMKNRLKKGELKEEDIESTEKKLFQINEMADELFEFFLANTQNVNHEMETDNAEYLLGEQLSSFISSLNIDERGIEWRDVNISVNYDYLMRIFDNALSNIEKYADVKKDISISVVYDKDSVGIVLANYIAKYEKTVKGNRIGLVNIRLMMGQMNGRAEHENDGERFKLMLWFPKVKQ